LTDQGARLTVAGANCLLRPSGALWVEAARLLAVADLHLEKGSAFARRGQLLPPYDTGETLGRLEREVAALDPAVIIFLGDSFHDGGGEARLVPEYATRLAGLAQGRRLIWIAGNHDAEGPTRLPGERADAHDLGGLLFRHMPAAGAAMAWAAGHLHPCARIVARGRAVRRRCFITDGARIVLPAFGAYAGGLNVRDAAFADLFVGMPSIIALGDARAHVVSWRSTTPD
jgi:DNA ligase-associated metallophosphoesterase